MDQLLGVKMTRFLYQERDKIAYLEDILRRIPTGSVIGDLLSFSSTIRAKFSVTW